MEAVFPFFVGVARSGTTLVRVMFDAHPQLAIPGESHFIQELGRDRRRYETPSGFDARRLVGDLEVHIRWKRWRVPNEALRRALLDEPPADFPDAMRRVFALYAAKKHKPRYGDKTPSYGLFLPLLFGFFPEARFVHVIRDGRNVALSVIEAPFGPVRLARAAAFWRERVTKTLADGAALPPGHYHQYRHEDLLADPPSILKGICEFLDLPYDEAMLRYHEDRRAHPAPHMEHINKPPTQGLRDWRAQMSKRDVRLFELIAGAELDLLGYERATSVEPLHPSEAALWIRAKAARTGSRLRTSDTYARAIELEPVRKAAAVYRRVAGTHSERAP